MASQNGSVVNTDLWNLPANGRDRFMRTLGRALTRRCPYCGSPGIYQGYFKLRESCPRCGVRFSREEGYFLGGYALNLVVAEFVAIALAILLIFKTDLQHMGLLSQEIVVLVLAALFPILFFPYSRGAWMALDLTLHPPGTVVERQLQGVIAPRDIDQPN